MSDEKGGNEAVRGGGGCGCFGICVLVFLAILVLVPEPPDTRIRPTTRVLEERTPTSPCLEAFADAASVSVYADTHEDLFPAYSACQSIDEWTRAYSAYPAAIDGGYPVEYAMRVCSGNQAVLGDTPICKAVNAPPDETSSLQASERTGPLGVPLPEGATLIRRTSGNPAEYVDPTATYSIEASNADIDLFFKHEMVRVGWFIAASGGGLDIIEFEKGDLMMHVYTSDSRFTLAWGSW